MTISLLEPVLRLRTPAGVSLASLSEMMSRCVDGSLVDLPGMRMDQRAPVVTTLAILIHLERRYRTTLASALGDAGMALVGPFDAPAFMQPVLPIPDVSAIPITDLDHTTTGAAHHYKPADVATIEQAFYALLASTWRQHIGRGKPGGARQRALTVLLGDGVTLASEVTTLADAYDAAAPSHPSPEGTFASHLLWTRPWVQEERHDLLPWPYLDCRPVRLTMTDGGVGAITVDNPNIRGRVDTGTGNIGDPHVPIRTDGKVLRLGRRITYRDAHAALCGSSDVARAAIVDLAKTGHQVRIGAVAARQGGTRGYWETTVAVERERWVLFGSDGSDRLSALSKLAVTQCAAAEGALSSALWTLFPRATRKDMVANAHIYRIKSGLIDALGPASLERVTSLMAQAPDEDEEAKAINAMCAHHLRETWTAFARTWPDLLAIANSSLRLNGLMRHNFQEGLFVNEKTPLSQKVHAVIAEMDNHLTPDNRASIRSAAAQLPLAGYVALAQAPSEWTTADAPALPALEQAVRALGRVRHRGASVGRVLAETEYPPSRINTLLAATGDHLTSLVAEIVRWLVAHKVEDVVLTDVIACAIADALGEATARDAARHRMALDYARASAPKKAREAA
jgi:hypothetical protein